MKIDMYDECIMRLESGRIGNPTMRTLLKLAYAYDVNLTDLFDGNLKSRI